MKVLKDSRVWIGCIGVALSLVLHEFFHILLHWGNIQSFVLFPDGKAIVEMVAYVPVGYNVQLEEFIAYGITVATLLITLGLIWKVSDKRTTRTFRTAVLPKWSTLHQLESHELYELALKTKVFDSRI
jgi:hypothetical protein